MGQKERLDALNVTQKTSLQSSVSEQIKNNRQKFPFFSLKNTHFLGILPFYLDFFRNVTSQSAEVFALRSVRQTLLLSHPKQQSEFVLNIFKFHTLDLDLGGV